MTFDDFCSQFDDEKRSRLSGCEYRVAKEAWNAALDEAIEIASSGELDPSILTKRIQKLKA